MMPLVNEKVYYLTIDAAKRNPLGTSDPSLDLLATIAKVRLFD